MHDTWLFAVVVNYMQPAVCVGKGRWMKGSGTTTGGTGSAMNALTDFHMDVLSRVRDSGFFKNIHSPTTTAADCKMLHLRLGRYKFNICEFSRRV